MSLKIAHLSDPHFGTILPGVKEALKKSLREQKPDLVVLSGDITQRARNSQFKEAYEFKESLSPFPVLIVPGNHDIPLFNLLGRLFDPYRGYTRYLGERESDLKLRGVRVVGLNSTSRWRHTQGKLDLKRVKEKYFQAPDDSFFKIAVVHHPLECAKEVDQKNRLRGREETYAFLAEQGFDLVLSGHVHDPHVLRTGNVVVCVAGTSLSCRTRSGAPNSYHIVDIERDPKRLTITRHDLKEGSFQPVPGWKHSFTDTGLARSVLTQPS